MVPLLPMSKRPLLKDIAEKVGVSVALVSYVLNDRFKNRISKPIADKIKQAAAELDYRPNQIAKSLKTNKTFTIGLIVADIANPFSSTLARIIEDEGAKFGYTVIFGSSDEDLQKFEKLTNAFVNRQVDGLIILPPDGSQQQIIRLKQAKLPFVIVDRYFPDVKTNCINVDNYQAAYDAVQHFVSNGRKRIAMIGYNTNLHHLNDRVNGYLGALKDFHIPFNNEFLKKVSIKNDPVEICDATKMLLSPIKHADAILFGSNRIAVHALKYISGTGLQISRDLQLIGFDETEVFDFFEPQISYVKQPMQELGQKATEILIQMINSPQTEENIFIPAPLVIRKSAKN